MHVEFLGLPGSGKTTLCATALRSLRTGEVQGYDAREALYRALRRTSGDALTRLALRILPPPMGRRLTFSFYARSTDRWAALTRFATDNPALLETVCRAPSVLEGSAEDRHLVFTWMLNLFATYDLARRGLGARDVLVLDEGFCNRAISLFARDAEPSETAVSRYLELIPAPDLVFVVEADPETRAGRLRDRGRPQRLRTADDETVGRRLRSAEICMRIAAERLPGLGSTVAHVANDGRLARATELVESRLRDLVAGLA